MRGEAQVTLWQACCISLPRDTLWTHCLYTSAFLALWFLFSVTDGKIEQCVCIKFCLTLSKSTTETLQMLHEAFGEHSLNQITFTFQGQSSVSWRWRTFRATKHQQNDRKCHRHLWDQLWSLLGGHNRKYELAPQCCEFCSPTLDKWSKAVARKHVSWVMREG
jgi:hypothetical protein